MAAKSISGRLSSRAVGCVELIISFVFCGVYVWYLDCQWNTFQSCSTCVLTAIFFAFYVIFAVVISLLLILSTFTVITLQTRKWIAVLWCTFDMFSFIGSVILICVNEAFESNAHLFLISVIFLLKWATFFCVVCTYVWGISEKIQDNKANTMPVSPIRMGTRSGGGGRGSTAGFSALGGGGLWLLRGKKDLGKMKISTKL